MAELGVADGLRAAMTLLLARPARLGNVRMIAIDGPSGSGKSTFAGLLADALRVASLDTVLLTTDLLATWDDPFDWWPEMETGVLQPLSRGFAGEIGFLDWSGGEPERAGTRIVPVPEVLVLEGVSAGRAAVRDRLSLLIWVCVPGAENRLNRAVARDGESSREYLRAWQTAEDAHFAGEGTETAADLHINPEIPVNPTYRALA